jgi:TatD DNase family protein
VEWFDSHCHLHLCEEQGSLPEIMERARQAGVAAITTVGIDVSSSRRALEIAREFGIWATVGIHPNEALEWSEGAVRALEALLADERVVAVGETGLDFYRERCPRDVQLGAFRAQIEMAKKHQMALVIHTRSSVAAASDCLEEVGLPDRVVYHCWSGDEAQLKRAIDLGAHISFAGSVSFKNAGDLRAAACLVPGDRLLVETDSPFLAPVPHRGRTNEPAFVSDVGRAVAEARGEDAAKLAEATTANARSLFGLS